MFPVRVILCAGASPRLLHTSSKLVTASGQLGNIYKIVLMAGSIIILFAFFNMIKKVNHNVFINLEKIKIYNH